MNDCTCEFCNNERRQLAEDFALFGTCIAIRVDDLHIQRLDPTCARLEPNGPEVIQCRRCGRVSQDDLCPRCAPPPVDNLHVAEGCEQFSSTPQAEVKQ